MDPRPDSKLVVTHHHSGQADRVRSSLLYQLVQAIRDSELEIQQLGRLTSDE
jgi:hypothetical protein